MSARTSTALASRACSGAMKSMVPSTVPGCVRRRSEEHTSELQSRLHLVCRLLLEKKKKHTHDVRFSATRSQTRSFYYGRSRSLPLLRTLSMCLVHTGYTARIFARFTELDAWSLQP